MATAVGPSARRCVASAPHRRARRTNREHRAASPDARVLGLTPPRLPVAQVKLCSMETVCEAGGADVCETSPDYVGPVLDKCPPPAAPPSGARAHISPCSPRPCPRASHRCPRLIPRSDSVESSHALERHTRFVFWIMLLQIRRRSSIPSWNHLLRCCHPLRCCHLLCPVRFASRQQNSRPIKLKQTIVT